MNKQLTLLCLFILFSFLSVGFAGAGDAAEKNPFTPKAFAIRYWDKEIRSGLPKPQFLLSKAPPMNAAAFAKLAARALHAAAGILRRREAPLLPGIGVQPREARQRRKLCSVQRQELHQLWNGSTRLPVLLVGAQVSLTPLHSATASAMFTSLLSLHNTNWGCLSEGTPLFFLHILDGLTCTIRVALTFHFNC
ncbi:Putative polygalacturonase non-catalytic subunit JP650 [Glycine soja]|uniref:Putative polygalacturonase non-catalytic subunit JP650 n=1 Tax=Glycine soja TaxID=3848 RepID=A0A0B2PWI7_GLYSO|nr:Putative polygalacturonase non-catalytic subunit JP650 [Glycine soja]